MIRTYYAIVLLTSAFFSTLLNAQITTNTAFKLYDLDLYTKDPASGKAAIHNSSIVEINGKILVKLDKAAINNAINEYAGGSSDSSVMVNIKQLKSLLRNQVEIMNRFKSDASGPDYEGLAQLAELMVGFLEEVEENSEWRAMYNDFSAKYDQTYTRAQRRTAGTGEIPYREEFIINQFSLKIADLASQIKQDIPTDKVKFTLSGTLRAKKGGAPRAIKLSDDFDDIAPDVYVVPRWQTSLSEDDIKDLNEIATLSNQLNQLMLAKGKDVKTWLKSQLQAFDCLKNVKSALESLPQDAENLTEAGINQMIAVAEAPLDKAAALISQYTKNESMANGITNVDMLTGLNANLNSTASAIDSLLKSMDEDVLKVLDQFKTSPTVQKYIGTYTDCKQKLLSDKNKLIEISKRFSNLIKSGDKASDAAIGIDEKVKRLNFDAIPAESKIDLTYSGNRQNGDEITITASLEKEVDGDVQTKTLGETQFSLQQIGLYSVVKPLLLLADPLGAGEHVDLERRFQFAPSYSILLKWGSRKSKFFNEVFSPSFGINFAAPDFDTDGVPEFAAAGEFSFLRDYLSVGLGYNFMADSDYYFVGFRLPIGAVPLPVFNDVEVK